MTVKRSSLFSMDLSRTHGGFFFRIKGSIVSSSWIHAPHTGRPNWTSVIGDTLEIWSWVYHWNGSQNNIVFSVIFFICAFGCTYYRYNFIKNMRYDVNVKISQLTFIIWSKYMWNFFVSHMIISRSIPSTKSALPNDVFWWTAHQNFPEL